MKQFAIWCLVLVVAWTVTPLAFAFLCVLGGAVCFHGAIVETADNFLLSDKWEGTDEDFLVAAHFTGAFVGVTFSILQAEGVVVTLDWLLEWKWGVLGALVVVFVAAERTSIMISRKIAKRDPMAWG